MEICAGLLLCGSPVAAGKVPSGSTGESHDFDFSAMPHCFCFIDLLTSHVIKMLNNHGNWLSTPES